MPFMMSTRQHILYEIALFMPRCSGWTTLSISCGGVDRTAIASISGSVDFHRIPQGLAIDIRPQGVNKHQFGVGGLPQQKIGEALLPGGAQKQINIRSEEHTSELQSRGQLVCRL